MIVTEAARYNGSLSFISSHCGWTYWNLSVKINYVGL